MKEEKKLSAAVIVANLADWTGEYNYQIFLNSLLGFSPESIDCQIIRYNSKQKDQGR